MIAVTRVVKRRREREREARFHHKIRRKVCSGCERRRSGRRARFSPSAQGMFPWINTIFAYPTVRRDIRRRTPISGARSRKRSGLHSGGEEVRAEEGRKSASYAIIVGRVPSARSSCDVTRRPYCAPSWTRSVIAIKKCDSHTWRRSRGFDRGVRKTGARRGERRLEKEEREGEVARRYARPPTTPAASRRPLPDDCAARVQAFCDTRIRIVFNLENINILSASLQILFIVHSSEFRK